MRVVRSSQQHSTPFTPARAVERRVEETSCHSITPSPPEFIVSWSSSGPLATSSANEVRVRVVAHLHADGPPEQLTRGGAAVGSRDRPYQMKRRFQYGLVRCDSIRRPSASQVTRLVSRQDEPSMFAFPWTPLVHMSTPDAQVSDRFGRVPIMLASACLHSSGSCWGWRDLEW